MPTRGEVETKRAEWEAWASQPERLRGTEPLVGNESVGNWLNTHDPEFAYVEGGSRVPRRAQATRRALGAVSRQFLKTHTGEPENRFDIRPRSEAPFVESEPGGELQGIGPVITNHPVQHMERKLAKRISRNVTR